jgi:GTP-binding protein
MPLPQVVIIGRPNVGKSSLLNRLAGRRVSIVEPTPGVTRDRVTVELVWRGRRFEVTDTGGLGLVDDVQLKELVEAQIEAALLRGDVVLFVVDGKEGLVPGDQHVAARLRKLHKPTLLVVNKLESHWDEVAIAQWRRLGFGEAMGVSALEGTGVSDLLDAVVERLPPAAADEGEEQGDALRFAIVGKRNSGKSTLVNALCGEERVIVSEVPGTTRDSVDVAFRWRDQQLVAIDTAGVRKKSSVQDAIELFSYTRATDGIRRADVVMLLFDIREPISQVDKRLAHYVVEHHKPVVLVGNKVDLAGRIEKDHWQAYIHQQLPGLDFAPVSFVSAQEGTNVDRTLEILFELREQARLQIQTGRLNQVLQEARDRLLPRSPGKVPKLFYGTQIGVEPLSVVVFVNDPRLFRGQYDRYLQNRLRAAFACAEVPIRIVFRRRQKVMLEPQE